MIAGTAVSLLYYSSAPFYIPEAHCYFAANGKSARGLAHSKTLLEFGEIGSTESRPTILPAHRSLGRATLCGASLLPPAITPLRQGLSGAL